MKKSLLTILFLTLILAFAFAQDYYVQTLDVEINVNRNAILNVKENYVFNFLQPHHGVYRDIPYKYDNTRARVNNIESSRPFSVEKGDYDYIVKIGDASETYKGSWPMVLNFDYDFGADYNEGWDEVYYNILSDASVIYENIHFTFKIPETVASNDIFISCGYYGSKEGTEYTVTHYGNNTVIEGYISRLNPGEALTVFVQLPDGWFQDARQMWDYRDTFKNINLIVCIALFALAAVLWTFNGRDKIPIVSAKFNPPENFSPLVVGFLADGQVDDKDITSMLYYWADKGYLSINEKKKNQFEFTLLKEIPSSEPEFEKFLFKKFFKGKDLNGKVELKDLEKTNFYDSMNKTKLNVVKFFTKDRKLKTTKSQVLAALLFVLSFVPFVSLGFSAALCEFSTDAIFPLIPLALITIALEALLFWALFRKWYIRKTNILMIVLCCVPFVFSLLLSLTITAAARGYAYVPGVLASCISSFALVLFASIMSKRTAYGDKLFEDTLGFREFIDKVSLGELTNLIDEDPMYYYHNLSYAIVLGLESKWAEKFSGIAVPPPVWYTGVSPFDVYFYSRMASRMNTQIREHAMPHDTKNGTHSSGGFNVGGFAGGGFGGGSVHAW